MKKHSENICSEIFPCPVNLHSNNGFDLARKMKKSARRSVKRSCRVSKRADTRHRYIIRNSSNLEKMIIEPVQERSYAKLIACAAVILLAIGLFLTMKYSMKIFSASGCFTAFMILFAGVCHEQKNHLHDQKK